jgi:hypothetical protein
MHSHVITTIMIENISIAPQSSLLALLINSLHFQQRLLSITILLLRLEFHVNVTMHLVDICVWLFSLWTILWDSPMPFHMSIVWPFNWYCSLDLKWSQSVPSLCYFGELVETLVGGSSGRKFCQEVCLWRGYWDSGPFLSLLPRYHEVSSLLCHMLLPWSTALPLAPKQWGQSTVNWNSGSQEPK